MHPQSFSYRVSFFSPYKLEGRRTETFLYDKKIYVGPAQIQQNEIQLEGMVKGSENLWLPEKSVFLK